MEQVAYGNWRERSWERAGPGIERLQFAGGLFGLTCALCRVENGHKVCPHTHGEEQVTILLEGTCDYYVDNRPYRMTPGSYVAVPSGREHYIHVYDSPVPCLHLEIMGAEIDDGIFAALIARGKQRIPAPAADRRTENEPGGQIHP